MKSTDIRRFYESNSDLVTGVFTCGYFSDDERDKVLNELLGGLSGKKVLDLGCGNMNMASVVFSLGADEYTGIDLLCKHEYTEVSQQGVTTTIQGDIHDLDELSAYKNYDIILLLDVLEHSRDPDLLIRACGRRLLSGGRLLICVPNYFSFAGIVKRSKEYTGRYPHNSWAPFSNQKPQLLEHFTTSFKVLRLLRNAGFRVVHSMGWDIIGGTWPFIYGEGQLVGFWGRHSRWYWKLNRVLWNSIPLVSKYCSMYFIVSAAMNSHGEK